MRTRKPPRSREQYILDSIPRIFKGGEWVEAPSENGAPHDPEERSSMGGEGVSGRPENGSGIPAQDSTSTRYMTIIGGQKFYEQALYDALEPFQHYIIGEGRGAESHIAKTYFEGEYTVVQVNPEVFGKNARKVNVEQVLCFAIDSPLLLVGDGTRVKQARDWLKRTLSRREVIELP